MLIKIPAIGLSFANVKKSTIIIKLPVVEYAGLRFNAEIKYGFDIKAEMKK